VRRARFAAAATGAALAVCAASVAAGAVAPPTGDRAAIDFYKSQADAYLTVRGATIHETGYYFVRPGIGRSVGYLWGGRSQAGYAAADATIHAQLAGGRIVAYLAVLKAPGVRTLRIVMSGGAVFTRTTSCWSRSRASASPLGTGERYVFNNGGAHFGPRRTVAGGTAVTFTYPWTAGARAAETDTFSKSRPARVEMSIRVGGTRPFTIHEAIVPLHRAPKLPIPPPPAVPAPKPLCTG
jgi:hypothetical protein